MKKYTMPCCRCGFCCLNEQCPRSLEWFGKTEDTCPALLFEDDGKAFCSLVSKFGENALGIGEGCCIKARVFSKDQEFDFSLLPPDIKFKVVKRVRSKEVIKLDRARLNSSMAEALVEIAMKLTTAQWDFIQQSIGVNYPITLEEKVNLLRVLIEGGYHGYEENRDDEKEFKSKKTGLRKNEQN